jgi:flagellar basal-body rod protein FlgF
MFDAGKFCRAVRVMRRILPRPISPQVPENVQIRRLARLVRSQRRVELGSLRPKGEQTMENTLLVGLSRQIALRRELDVIANNLANLNTAGFKAENVLFERHLFGEARSDHFALPADRRINFVLDRETRTDMAQGPFTMTGSKLDAAIDGDGFFVVETPEGERYTRAGTFSINATGELVTPAGHRVLGAGGPIVVDPENPDIMIAADGTVSDRTQEFGQLRLVRFENSAQLAKHGDNTYAAEGIAPLPADARTRVVQGAIEKSNVQPVMEIGRMIEVTRAYTTLASLMNRTEELRRNAIERLADVPA